MTHGLRKGYLFLIKLREKHLNCRSRVKKRLLSLINAQEKKNSETLSKSTEQFFINIDEPIKQFSFE
jgi:hypothetical protein